MKYLWSLLVVVILVACQSVDRMPKPENLIPEEQMVNILVDLTLYDAGRRLGDRDVYLSEKKIRPYIYEKYNIDSLQLVESNRYYVENIKIYEPIIDSVKKQINNIKTEIDTLKAIDKRRKDSIREAKREGRRDSTPVVKLKPLEKLNDSLPSPQR